MLFGKYLRDLDEKNRLMLPKQLKDKLSGNLYLLRGYDGCLSLFQEKEFEEYVSKLSSLSYTHKDTRDIQRLGFSSTFELSVDKQGRIQIPTQIFLDYNLTKEVVVVGVINHLEIWSKEAWDKYEIDNKEKFEDISENLPF